MFVYHTVKSDTCMYIVYLMLFLKCFKALKSVALLELN